MARANYVHQTAILHRAAADPRCRWRFHKHALDRMAEFRPSVTQPDIKNAVTKGHVVFEENKKDLVWRVRGPDLDGSYIKVQVTVDEAEPVIRVITVF